MTRCKICKKQADRHSFTYVFDIGNTSDYCDLVVCKQCEIHPCMAKYKANDLDRSNAEDIVYEKYADKERAIIKEWSADILKQRTLFNKKDTNV